MRVWAIGLVLVGVSLVSCTAPTLPTVSPPPPSATVALTRYQTASPNPLQPTALPSATALPTATPTPQTHTVQTGETLLGIAIQYGIRVEDLSAANPSVLANFLSVGQVLVIPPAEGGQPLLQAVTPTPLALATPLWHCQAILGGGQTCLAWLENPYPQPLANLAVQVQLGEQVQVVIPALNVLGQGERVPLLAQFSHGNGALHSQWLSAGGGEAVAEQWLRLTVDEQQTAMQGENWQAQVTLRNESSTEVQAVRLVISWVGVQGELLGFRVVDDAQILPANEVRTYQTSAFLPGGQTPIGIEVLAEGKK
jgi:LysM repeat protein